MPKARASSPASAMSSSRITTARFGPASRFLRWGFFRPVFRALWGFRRVLLPGRFWVLRLPVPFFLFVGTQFAPMITELGLATKAITIPAGQLISNSSIDAIVWVI